MRFVIDMNLSPAWATELDAAGHDAVHWRSVGPGEASDDRIMAWASEHDRGALTADLGFAAEVARQQLAAPTIIQLRCGSTDPNDIGRHVLDAIAAAEPELTSGAILTIDDDRARLRPGPQIVSFKDEP